MLPEHWSVKGRAETLHHLADKEWDIIIIGGGISGAGLLFEASRRGYRALLLEKNDFASGSSSQSSKLVHGGIRYLATGQLSLTRNAVQAREHLCQQLPGLVEHLPLVMPHYRNHLPGRFKFRALMWLYDLLAGKKYHKGLSVADIQKAAPSLRSQQCYGATQFKDAITDDARLTLRVLLEAAHYGGKAFNYCKVDRIQLLESGNQSGGFQIDISPEDHPMLSLSARQVIHATGAWTQSPRAHPSDPHDDPVKIRPLRGSHLLFSQKRLPLEKGVCLVHPDDSRLMFALPWLGHSLVGTTDLDHKEHMDDPIQMQQQEQDYLFKALNHYFPASKLTPKDCLSVWSGVRPVLSEPGSNPEHKAPSDEHREHKLWWQDGQLYLCGGKLTTFQKMAEDAIDQLPFSPQTPVAKPWPDLGANSHNQGEFLLIPETLHQMYGADVLPLNKMIPVEQKVAATPYYKAELHWALAHLAVKHLDDLLLRRTRIGLLYADGGTSMKDELKTLCQKYMQWDDTTFEDEWLRYQQIYRSLYQQPDYK
ncbi:glycerol-3-phosphate dehydrogenase/oxidase [Oceanospirillum sp.]|uniref:glycerol-3-phosphate dehydrogenase/oxidase n=1 Tax=Oceanospirillum sp. TaxID=2021254 RepID=UPI003A945895